MRKKPGTCKPSIAYRKPLKKVLRSRTLRVRAAYIVLQRHHFKCAGLITDNCIGGQRPQLTRIFNIARQTKGGTFGTRLHQPFRLPEVPFRTNLPLCQQC